MSQIIAWGSPLSKRYQLGETAVMSFVKYNPQSVPANTCCGNLGFAIIESTGTSGRLPVLLLQVKEAQLAVQTTRKTWPGVGGVLALKPPTAAYPIGAVVVAGSKATSNMGRLGRMRLLSVTFTHVDWFEPVPRPRPIWTLPSLVPTIT